MNAIGDDVNMSIYRRLLLASLVLVVPTIATAVGLGKLDVLSLLGQPLNAEIDLVSVQKEDFSALSAQLASTDDYRRSGLQYSAVIAGLRFQIDKRPNGQPFIKLTSEQTVNDPFVDLVIELNWSSGRLLREYTALINPGNYAPTQALVLAPVIVAQTSARPFPQAPLALAVPLPTAMAATVEYGPVKRGETLSKIAFTVKSDGVSREQMMIGILRNNPDAFINNNMNRLKADQKLRIPDHEQLIKVSQSDAVKEVLLHVAKRNPYRLITADAASAVSPRKTVVNQRQKRKSAIVKPVLRLSSGDPTE